MNTMRRANVPVPDTAHSGVPPSGLAASAAELPADVLAAIEREMRVSVSDVPPELVRHAVAASKKLGNDAFASARFSDAARFYTQALAGAPDDKALRSNRSAAYLALGRTDEAVADAVRCVALDKAWPKAHYRLGKALATAGEWHAAAASLETCARLMTGVGLQETPSEPQKESSSEPQKESSSEPPKSSSEGSASEARRGDAAHAATLDGVLELLAVAQAESEDARGRVVAQELAKRRAFAARLRAARHADDREATLARWRQTMSGPEWDVEDQDWRPTFAPNARLSFLNRRRFDDDPRRAGVLAHFKNLAELAAPKTSLAALGDAERVRAYARAAKRLVAKKARRPAAEAGGKEKGVSALCLSGGGPGVLPLCAAAAGAAHTLSVERGPFCFRAARGVCRANEARGLIKAGAVTVLDKPIDAVDPVADARGFEADVVLVDCLDRAGGLGMRLVRSIDAVARKGIASVDALVAPRRLKTFACLAQIRVESVRGLDLRAMNAYRWHPQTARFDPRREPHVLLSDAFEVFELDLQARLRAKTAEHSAKSRTDGDSDARSDSKKRVENGAASWDEDFRVSVPVVKDGAWNAVVFWFEADMGHSGDVLRSAEPPPPISRDRFHESSRNAFTATSWGLAAQYLDEVFVRRGETAPLRVRRDDDQVFFASEPPPVTPRTGAIPTWHYDMLNDAGRNEAYDRAIACAVGRVKRANVFSEKSALPFRKELGSPNPPVFDARLRPCSVIDAGSGSGLLAMFAARAGADHVTAIERSAHMTDVGEEIACVNGFAGAIHCLHRDARHVLTRESLPGALPLNGALKPDGVPTEMQKKADMMVYEIFDSGLIGEGALHVIAYARSRLLRENHVLVPARARMFAQLIETRFGETEVELGGFDDDDDDADDDDDDAVTKRETSFVFDFSHANRWRWREEYEGIDLESDANRGKWRALSAPFETFAFDFYDVTPETLAPETRRAKPPIVADGVCNAVAFWFELELGVDEHGNAITLSTSPYDGTKGQTWQQAVQYLEEFAVNTGDAAPILATHDTYGVSFAVDDADGAFETFASRRDETNAAPSHDPAWGAAYAAAKKIDHALTKAVTQNPLEYRAVAEVAVAAGARPADLGLDAETGAEFCVKYMG